MYYGGLRTPKTPLIGTHWMGATLTCYSIGGVLRDDERRIIRLSVEKLNIFVNF